MEPMVFECRDKKAHARRGLNSLATSRELRPASQYTVQLVFLVRLLGVSGAGLQTIDPDAEDRATAGIPGMDYRSQAGWFAFPCPEMLTGFTTRVKLRIVRMTFAPFMNVTVLSDE